jgi:hypothetical protein
MPGVAGGNGFVIRIGFAASGVSGNAFGNAVLRFEYAFHAPETASGEIGLAEVF